MGMFSLGIPMVRLARKSTKIFCQGMDIPSLVERGYELRGIETLVGLEQVHHTFLYNMYVNNPSRRLDMYTEELF